MDIFDERYECADCGVVFGITGHEGCQSDLSPNGLHHPVLCGETCGCPLPVNVYECQEQG
jgi:hypothetical protein